MPRSSPDKTSGRETTSSYIYWTSVSIKINNLFLYSHWISLPLTTRHKIAAQFGIVKKGPTEVVANVVKSDGYVIQEIEQALNTDALQKYLETSETDTARLWVWLTEKIEGKSLTKFDIDTTVVAKPTEVIFDTDKGKVAFKGIKTELKPRRGRPRKK